MLYRLTDRITVLGKTIIKPDRSFSFNAYLVTGEKNVLIDTVPGRAADGFMDLIKSCIPIESLDAVILNHSEEDHSGALPELLKAKPNLPVYCNAACREHLKETLPGARFILVADGSTIQLGDLTFSFYLTPGLHWDDNMATYFFNEGVLFSNDLFGQSAGTELPLDTQIERKHLLEAASDYYQRVFSAATKDQKQAVKRLAYLELNYIAPGHGVILKSSIAEILALYESLCS